MNEYKKVKANVAKVKEKFSAYLAKVEKGESVIVCRRNQPVAELVPATGVPLENRTKLGSARGSVVVKCDLTESAIPASDWDVLQ